MFAAMTTFQWTALTDTGAVAIAYDTLRSDDPSSFSTAFCLESSGADLQSADGFALAPGVLRSYLVRGVNACPAPSGEGSLGTRTGGTPRTAPPCP